MDLLYSICDNLYQAIFGLTPEKKIEKDKERRELRQKHYNEIRSKYGLPQKDYNK